MIFKYKKEKELSVSFTCYPPPKLVCFKYFPKIMYGRAFDYIIIVQRHNTIGGYINNKIVTTKI